MSHAHRTHNQTEAYGFIPGIELFVDLTRIIDIIKFTSPDFAKIEITGVVFDVTERPS